MTELKTIAAQVRTLLEHDTRCRNSDSFLYLSILFLHAEKNGVNLHTMTIPDFLKYYHGTIFPIFETVRRARQKVQQHCPDLAACNAVEGFRAENELAFKAFAVGDV